MIGEVELELTRRVAVVETWSREHPLDSTQEHRSRQFDIVFARRDEGDSGIRNCGLGRDFHD
jgi:hypothetical protein